MSDPNPWYPLKNLTGGGDAALDSLDGDALNDGDRAIVITTTFTYHYILEASSGEAEDSPWVISPDTNAGTKRWVLKASILPSMIAFDDSGLLTLPVATAVNAICFGDENSITGLGNDCAVIGGVKHTIADSSYCDILGGYQNDISDGGSSVVCAGYDNAIASSSYCGIFSGYQNNISGGGSSMVGSGYYNYITSDYAFIGGGYGNVVSAELGSILGGVRAAAYLKTQSAFACGQFSAAGDAQSSKIIIVAETTNATPGILYVNQDDTIDLVLPASRSWKFTISAIARQTAGGTGTVGDSAFWTITGGIKRDASNNTALIGTPQGHGVPGATDRDAAAAAWDLTVTANDTDEALVLTFTGEADKTIHVVAKIELVEVG